MQRPLAERGFVAGRDASPTAATSMRPNRRRADVLRRQQATDERLQSSQLAQLRASTAALNHSLDIARAQPRRAQPARAGRRASSPPSTIQVGQSLQRGERLGQIDSAGRNKLRAQVDEFYLGRVAEGQTANAEVGGRTYRMRVTKIYPQVRNGAFEIDLAFVGERAAASCSAARPCRSA